MTSFSYKARDPSGKLVEGRMDAENSRAVALQLSKLGYAPLSINANQGAAVFDQFTPLLAYFQRVSMTELIVFTRQLASILQAGVPLLEGLEAVHDQIKNPRFKTVVMAVKKDIEEGVSFSDALEKRKNIFSLLIVNMVRAGERAGILDEELDRISNLLEKEFETGEKIKAATRYPLIVVISLGIAFTVLTAVVIPKFVVFFGNFKTELPLPTRILIGMNYVVAHFWYWILAVIFFGVYLFKRTLNTEKGRYSWDKLMLAAPIFGPLFQKIYLSRFARMLAAMLRSGIPILDALAIAAATVENKVVTKVVMELRTSISQGKSLTEPMKKSALFPPIAVSMVAIGEKAGSLETMLNRLADYFDREADYTIRNLTPLLEPVLIFGLGLIVLLFAMGIFLPMWDLIKVYKTY